MLLFPFIFMGFILTGCSHVSVCVYGFCYYYCCCCFCRIHDEIVSHTAVCVHWNLIPYRNVLMNRCCLVNTHIYADTHSFTYTSISVLIFSVVVWCDEMWCMVYGILCVCVHYGGIELPFMFGCRAIFHALHVYVCIFIFIHVNLCVRVIFLYVRATVLPFR